MSNVCLIWPMVSGSLARPKILDMALHTKRQCWINAYTSGMNYGFFKLMDPNRGKTIETRAFSFKKNAVWYVLRILPSIRVNHQQKCTSTMLRRTSSLNNAITVFSKDVHLGCRAEIWARTIWFYWISFCLIYWHAIAEKEKIKIKARVSYPD